MKDSGKIIILFILLLGYSCESNKDVYAEIISDEIIISHNYLNWLSNNKLNPLSTKDYPLHNFRLRVVNGSSDTLVYTDTNLKVEHPNTHLTLKPRYYSTNDSGDSHTFDNYRVGDTIRVLPGKVSEFILGVELGASFDILQYRHIFTYNSDSIFFDGLPINKNFALRQSIEVIRKGNEGMSILTNQEFKLLSNFSELDETDLQEFE